MVDTSSLSGVMAASGFDSSSSTRTSDSNAGDMASLSSYSTHSDSNPQRTSTASGRVDTSSLSGIEALSREPTTPERILNTPTAMDSLSGAHDLQNERDASALETLPSGTWAAGHGMAMQGYDLLVDNPILTKTYESTRSAWTSEMGFTANADERLRSAGISTVTNINPPPGSVTRSQGAAQGISPGTAANINGALAEEAIADRYRAQGYEVETQARFDADFNPIDRAANQPGDRAVDVAVHRPHPSDPRLNAVNHIESKAFRVSNTDQDIKPSQFAHDVGMLENNRTLRATGVALERTGRVLRPVGLAVDAVTVGSAINRDGGIGVETGRTVTGIAGGAGGGWAGATSGAAIGATLGSAIPIVGTAAGAIIGGVIGGLGGAAIGEKLATGAFDTIKGWFS